MPELQRYDWGQDERDHTEILPNPIGRYVLAADAEKLLGELRAAPDGNIARIKRHWGGSGDDPVEMLAQGDVDHLCDEYDFLKSEIDAALDALRKTKKALHRMLTVYLEPQGQAEAERIALAALDAADAILNDPDAAAPDPNP